MKKIGVAVIGVGSLGQHHVRIFSELPQAELLGVVDLREDRARQIAELHGCRWYSRHTDLPDGVQAVSLVVPTRSHAEIGKELLEQGIHVLVEKPITHTLAAADELLQAASKSGAILHVGHSERFSPVLAAVRPYISEPQFFEAHRLGVLVPRSLDVDVVLDLMIHDLDLILHLTQARIAEIRAVGIPVLTPRVDIANARLEFENGCVANVTASRVSKERIRKLRFFQPHDYVSLDFHNQILEMYSLRERQIVERSLEIRKEEPLRLELEAFLEAVDGKPSALACTGEAARTALSLALHILREIQ